MENLKHQGTPTANFVTQSVAGDDPFEAGNQGQFYLFIYLKSNKISRIYKHLLKLRIKTVYNFS